MTAIDPWRDAFFEAVKAERFSERLKEASLNSDLKNWTSILTDVLVTVCEKNNWAAAAKGHPLTLMPESNKEYLGIDIMAFEKSRHSWLFPAAAIELENSKRDERVAYSLWKVLNIHTPLRMVFCYRPEAHQGAPLIKYLARQVVESMRLDWRAALQGETMVVVGYRNRAETFPYSFFKWWILNRNTGEFEQY
ncbi:MAG: hypothetical protein CV087_21010 [Candidatus Brocadia sp. WS118]|nr:MAG: hypothetical protein CV087_21010 [Candidatus Brocadia sp. WS118]